MPTISDGQIAAAAKGAGLSGDAVAIAVAVALAESGGNTTSHNAIPPDDSYGLWQINMLGSMGPARRKQFGLSSNTDLYDPNINAKAMASISNGGKNWQPWTTYTRGTYKLYLARGQAAAGNSSAPVQAQNVGAISELAKLGNLIADPAVYRKAGLYILGGVLILIAFLMFAAPEAVKALPADKVLSSVGKAVKK